MTLTRAATSDEAEACDRSEEHAGDHGAHDRILRSVGSRPIRIIRRYAATQARAAMRSTSVPAGRRIATDHRGLEAHHQQHEPGRRDGEPGAVHRPRLPGLHLGAGARLVAQVSREVAQQPPELATAHLARDPQPLDHTVTDRVGEAGLEPVEGLTEAAGHLVVEREGVERRTQRLRPADRQGGQGVGQRQPGPDGRGEVVDRLRPHLRELAPAAPPPCGDDGHREEPRHHAEEHRDRRRAGHHLHQQRDGSSADDAQGRERGRRDVAQPRTGEQLGGTPSGPAYAGNARHGERRPHEQQPHPDAEPDQRAHQRASFKMACTSRPRRS